MQTNFSKDQLASPEIAVSNEILRKCVHCGFCIATCPTYILLGDELDSPRGRIYQIREMLETGNVASASLVKHMDRCLSCLSCMTTCPASVDYMHLVDLTRVRIEKSYIRPLAERLFRTILSVVIPSPYIFQLCLIASSFFRPVAWLLPGRIKGLVNLAPKKIEGMSFVDRPQVFLAEGPRRFRVALMNGCAQQALRPEINEATVRLLTRHGCEVVVATGAGCCGALVHHMGDEERSHKAAKANIMAWEKLRAQNGGLDAIVVNASGCGTTVKDYGFIFRNEPDWAERAAWVSKITQDVTEVLDALELKNIVTPVDLPIVAYHSACSMQHGQKLNILPTILLKTVGFEVRKLAEGHLCCGSAGTYNILQPELAKRLQFRKVSNILDTKADVVATGNIGCIMQIADGMHQLGGIPVVHTVELIDWATGGPKPHNFL